MTPGLVDCHTHLVFAGDRSGEWEQRLAGATYETIAAAGGGIRSTVAATRAATEDELLDGAAARAARLAAGGVTTIEVKSGYGLDLDTELRMLRVARRIPERVPVGVSHDVPRRPHRAAGVRRRRRRLHRLRVRRGAAGRRRRGARRRRRRVLRGHRLRRRADRARLRGGDAPRAAGEAARRPAHRRRGRALAARYGALSADHLEHARRTASPLSPPPARSPCCCPAPPTCCDDEAGRRSMRSAAPGCRWRSRPTATRNVAAAVAALAMHLACTRFGLTVDEAFAGATEHARAPSGSTGRPACSRPVPGPTSSCGTSRRRRSSSTGSVRTRARRRPRGRFVRGARPP